MVANVNQRQNHQKNDCRRDNMPPRPAELRQKHPDHTGDYREQRHGAKNIERAAQLLAIFPSAQEPDAKPDRRRVKEFLEQKRHVKVLISEYRTRNWLTYADFYCIFWCKQRRGLQQLGRVNFNFAIADAHGDEPAIALIFNHQRSRLFLRAVAMKLDTLARRPECTNY